MDWIILIAAAFGAGVLNTIAGGGTFLTFPALVFAGLPPVPPMRPVRLRCCLAICPARLGLRVNCAPLNGR